MNDFYRMLKVLKNDPQQRFALATIIEVVGSNYRRVGAKMLFAEDNNMYGILSAGCLEEDLAHHAQNVIRTQTPQIVTYDLMSEDILSWGENIGCNGKITIYVEAIDWQQIAQLEPFLLDGKNIISIKCTNGEQAGVTLYSLEETDIANLASIQLNLDSLLPDLQAFSLSDRHSYLIFSELTQSHYFFERYRPRERLYIFGAGPDAEPIVSLAAQLDFAVTVIDPRESRCNATYFPLADDLNLSHPTAFLQKHPLPQESYVLVMTHNFSWDQTIVQHLMEHTVRYLGVLGPRRRTESMLPDRSFPDWLHSPVGLSIGAEGPEEISISILSQLIQERNKRGSNQDSSQKERLPASSQVVHLDG